MIQIEKRGRVPKYRITCGNCGTVFTCEKVDLYPSYIDATKTVTDCPLCRMEVEIKPEDEIKEEKCTQ